MPQETDKLGVIGLGYVGLPLAVTAARAEVPTLGFDIVPEIVEIVNAGGSHIRDLSDDDVASLREGNALEATTDFSRLAECSVVSICVPTPLSKTRDPDISQILSASRAVAEALQPGQLIVLESTTYPGTTREVVLPLLEEGGLEVGEDIFLCFSPERVDPANPRWKTANTPKVIGGITDACLERGLAFYSRFVERMVPVSSTEAAELTKLLENTFRAVNIALVNETAQIADRLNVDVWEVIDAAASKPFGFMKFTPGPGLGGHCIPVDPHYLSWKMRTLNYRARFIELASEVNAEMPHFVVEKVREALNRRKKPVNGSRVLVVGVAYKKDVDDVRESPAVDILRLLEADGAEVAFHDPYVALLREDHRTRTSVQLSDDVLREADLTLLLTDHSELDLDQIFDQSQVLVDARNATARVAAKRDEGRPGSWIVKG